MPLDSQEKKIFAGLIVDGLTEIFDLEGKSLFKNENHVFKSQIGASDGIYKASVNIATHDIPGSRKLNKFTCSVTITDPEGNENVYDYDFDRSFAKDVIEGDL